MNAISNKNKHLSLQERFIIENGIRNGSSKKAIADTLGKDKSTIGKEIKLHRSCSYKCKLPLECSAYKKCSHGRLCSSACPDFIPFICARRDRSPGACNGCTNFHRCRFDKFVYSPDIAHKEYRSSLIDSRLGINVNSSPKEKLNGKSPIEYLEFLNPLLFKKFYDFGVTKIDKDKVILKPYLIKK